MECGNILLVTQSADDSHKDHKKLSIEDVQYTTGNLYSYREYEQQKLESIKLLTDEEMSNIDQWLLDLHQVYGELRYPISHRIWQTITYRMMKEKNKKLRMIGHIFARS